MTLNTRIRVLDPIDVHEFFRLGQRLLAERDEQKRPVEEQQCTDGEWRPGQWSIRNQLGQGLPGIWDVDYRPNAPLRAEDDGHDEDCDSDCSGNYDAKACYAEASIDTSYGYRDAFGDVGDLHGWFLGHLINWLDGKGVRYSFQDEGTGDWYSDRDGLLEIAGSGAAAQEWFKDVVVPYIALKAQS